MTMTNASIDELVEGMRSIWEHSVDELDASVALEAGGVNDALAASRFGVRDVADLAEQLTGLVPARVSADEFDIAPIPYLRLAFRGLLFAVPGLFYLVIAHAYPGTAATYTLIISMLSGWGLCQAVAVVAYRVLGRAGAQCAARILRGLLTGTAILAVVALSTAAALHELPLAALAAGQILYVIAATVLMFHGGDRLLALSLAPGALIAAAYLAHLGIPTTIAVAAVAVTVAAALGSAWYRAHVAGRGTAPMERITGQDLLACVPYLVQGVLSGAAVAYVPLRMMHAHVSADVHSIDLSIVPLVLSMGFAEIELLRLRAAGTRLMQRTDHLDAYRRGASRLVLRSQLRFLAVLVASSVIVAGLVTVTTGFNRRDLTLMGAYATLGTALLAALILVAVNRVYVALWGFVAAGCVIAAAVGTARYTGLSMSVEGGFLASCLVLLTCFTVLAARALRDPLTLA